MKKILIGLLIIFATYQLLCGIDWLRTMYFPATTIGRKNYDKLFEYCRPEISVAKYPKTANELKYNKNISKDRYLLYDKLDPKNEAYMRESELYKLLGDKVSRDNKTSFKVSYYGDQLMTSLFYNYKNELMMIEQEYHPSDISIIDCHYTANGNLGEAIFSNINNDRTSVFNSKRQFMYDMVFTHFGAIVSEMYNHYVIK